MKRDGCAGRERGGSLCHGESSSGFVMFFCVQFCCAESLGSKLSERMSEVCTSTILSTLCDEIGHWDGSVGSVGNGHWDGSGGSGAAIPEFPRCGLKCIARV